MIYASILGISGFLLLILNTNWLTVGLGLLAYITYILIYGYTKRRSRYGTLVGSIAGALPPVAGYTAVTGVLDLGAGLIFIILVTWQMAHFYSIAIYRQKDYKSAGLPVWPITRGVKSTKRQIVGYIFCFLVAASLLSVFGYTGVIYLIVMLIAGLLWLRHAIKGYSTDNDVLWARQNFKFSLIIILVLSVAMSFGGLTA